MSHELADLLTMIRNARMENRKLSPEEIERAETLADRAMENQQDRKEVLDLVLRDR